MPTGGRTRVFAVLGDPIEHSLSPAMHNAVFHALGLDAVYIPMRCAAPDLPVLMRTFAAAGGGGNVTVPHKEIAAGAVDDLRGTVARACNTFWGEGGRLVGDNTDVAGISAALAALNTPAGPWLVVGTGGSARAVIAAAAMVPGARRVAVRSRSADRAEALLSEAQARGLGRAEAAECVIVCNATPLGLKADDPLPVTPDEVPRAEVALDLVYARRGTEWCRAMANAGVRVSDGREVLVAQGAEALRRWFPDRMPPLEIMRAAVHRALA